LYNRGWRPPGEVSAAVRRQAASPPGTVVGVIEVNELTKRYGATTAVNNLSFTVWPGQATGFLGPNGAGKSTTLRMILGLHAPTSDTVTVDGRPFRDRSRGLRHVGSLLDAQDVHGGHTAAAHLSALARSNRIPRSRVAEVLREMGSRRGRSSPRRRFLSRHETAAGHRRRAAR
jgi:ABC-2 type transport system ATP-binding protein